MDTLGVMIAVGFLQLIIWRESIATEPREKKVQYGYVIKATWFEDAEQFWTVEQGETRWSTYTKEAKYLGLLFAGKSEFPWIVDIRVERKSQEFWATGNLINYYTVFTTCRAIENLGDIKNGQTEPRVTFAEMYLFDYTVGKEGNWPFGGSRNVLDAKKHPKCNFQQEYYDGGVITLTKAIMPAPPTIDTIQLPINYLYGLLRHFDLSKMNDQRIICYVASFGRDFKNINNTLVKDFKVKYRVYWEDPSLCQAYSNRMCPSRQLSNEDCILPSDKRQPSDELMCFKSRAKVGAVCDHDKGAPLVCDGKVFGVVVRGAKEEYCNDALPLPFWVQRISVFSDYFDPSKVEGTGKRVRESKTRPFSSSAGSFFSGIQRLLPISVSFIYYLVKC